MFRTWFRADTRVYDKKAKAPPEGFDDFSVFDNAEWLEALTKYVRGLREARKKGVLVPEPYLVAAHDLVRKIANIKGSVTVLDYGGGIGPCIDPLTYQVPEAAVNYIRVDGQRMR